MECDRGEVKMATISVCMIVKNEEKQLDACLRSLKPIADEIIIVDTGSTDRTKKIASEFTDKIYDFEWVDDFSAARNFAFSKAKMDYIYTADADEEIDSNNIRLFLDVKRALLPEIEIVQMHYLNMMETNTAYNSKRELRPKLFKRLRTFEWINPVHETIRLDPIVYNSDIEIMHLAKGSHAARDFAAFQKALKKGMRLDKTLHSMYAKELFIAGEPKDFDDAEEFFEGSLNDETRSVDEKREAACVLARGYRLNRKIPEFFQLALCEAANCPPSEICAEIGEYFFSLGYFSEALSWYSDALLATEPIISVYVQGPAILKQLANCYEINGDLQTARKYRRKADNWEPPEML